jgi:acyl-CoA thioesterase-1
MTRLRSYATALATLLGLLTFGSTRGAGPEILILGDSLSAAYGLATADGWVSLLQGRLAAESPDYRAVNASVSGETTAGGLTRLPDLLKAHRPAVLVVELGANDGLRGFGLETVRANLTRLVDLGKGAGAKVLLVGVRLPPNYGAGYTDAIQAVYRGVAETEKVPLLPDLLAGVSTDLDLMQPDGLHPTAKAQPAILDNVWPLLSPLLH